MLKPRAKAQFLALLVFSVLYFGAVIVVALEPSLANVRLLGLLLNLDAYLACVVAGYLAAAITHDRGIIAGMLTGILAACLVAIYHFISGPAALMSSDWRFWLASVGFGSVGGLLWELRKIKAAWST